MAWCRQATSHYLSQCRPRSLSPYGVTRLQLVKGTAHNKDVIFGNIYKPPNYRYCIENIKAFTTDIENVIHELDRKNSEIRIAGDYNINLLNMDVRQAFSLFPHLPTGLDRRLPVCTLIDNIYI